MIWHAVGIIATVLTSFSFIPQIIKAIKSKSVKDVSIVTLFQFSLGVSFWTLYGVYLKNPIIIAANITTLATLLCLIWLYFKFR
ncbi:MAG: hypothetical protein FJZ15_05540 [Candidatus Omnitrophica bacterium]|nr:hypothetical protein [Candidatus Omnitrophota bacterium]